MFGYNFGIWLRYRGGAAIVYQWGGGGCLKVE